ncbi:glycosyltransferase [Pseudorhodoferax sp. Leaf267]|uniref:glycosyltransferase n=1 Tax=Pseudorhodoferax sp. Leaf267 TaxID=1736316 RepID=UPI001F15CA1B|nr:glycosyltransferase family 2 protein [Pseudorhodoferax sp. Leaf267]
MRRPITVSIVSHGQQELLLPLLDQLDALSSEFIARIVVTINTPEPDLLAGRNGCIPVVRIENNRPKGFGANHNAAFARCKTDWFLVLNPDVRFNRDVLQSLLAHALPNDGLLAPRIFEPGKQCPEPHRRLLTPLEILQRESPGYRPPAKPTWVPGMFMLLRAYAYKDVNGFDPRFFMYGEDFDLCIRLKLKGWQISTAEHLFAYHDARRASQRLWRHKLWHINSLISVWFSGAFWKYRSRQKCKD